MSISTLTGPRPRRWLWAILAVIGVLSACAVPATWAIAMLVRPDAVADSPIAAVDGVMGPLEHPEGLDPAEATSELGAYIPDEQFTELRGLVAKTLTDLESLGARLERGRVDEERLADDRVRLTVQYRVVVTRPPTTTEYRGWTFETVKVRTLGDGGWKVAGITAPTICQAYLRC